MLNSVLVWFSAVLATYILLLSLNLNRYFIIILSKGSKLFNREIKLWDTNCFMLPEREIRELWYYMFVLIFLEVKTYI